jgi:uncharacterized protein (DUF362 family)
MRTRRRNTPDIGIAKNDNESLAISEALNLIQADNLINNSDVVVITPNWVQQQMPETGVVVGPDSLREVIRFAKKNNPKKPQKLLYEIFQGEDITAAKTKF